MRKAPPPSQTLAQGAGLSALTRRWVEAGLKHKVALQTSDLESTRRTLIKTAKKRDGMTEIKGFLERYGEGKAFGRNVDARVEGIISIIQAQSA